MTMRRKHGLPFGERWLSYEEKLQAEEDRNFRLLGITAVITSSLVFWYFVTVWLLGLNL